MKNVKARYTVFILTNMRRSQHFYKLFFYWCNFQADYNVFLLDKLFLVKSQILILAEDRSIV